MAPAVAAVAGPAAARARRAAHADVRDHLWPCDQAAAEGAHGRRERRAAVRHARDAAGRPQSRPPIVARRLSSVNRAITARLREIKAAGSRKWHIGPGFNSRLILVR